MVKVSRNILLPTGALLIGVLWWGSWYLSATLAGTKPKQVVDSSPESEAENVFAVQLRELQAKAQENPKSVAAWQAYRDMLEAAIGHAPDASLYAELHQTYRTLVEISDAQGSSAAKEKLADLHFGLKNFREARDLYQELLSVRGDDQSLRGRLASTLTFLQDYDQAISELKKIIATNPESFQGYAYLSITYAQMGQVEKAEMMGEKALQFAPTNEARARFQAFLDSFPSVPKGIPEDANPLEVYLRTNEITKHKLISIQQSDGVVRVLFKDFPIQAMPEFAKQKFVATLKEKAKESAVQEIVILDAESTTELLRVSN